MLPPEASLAEPGGPGALAPPLLVLLLLPALAAFVAASKEAAVAAAAFTTAAGEPAEGVNTPGGIAEEDEELPPDIRCEIPPFSVLRMQL